MPLIIKSNQMIRKTNIKMATMQVLLSRGSLMTAPIMTFSHHEIFTQKPGSPFTKKRFIFGRAFFTDLMGSGIDPIHSFIKNGLDGGGVRQENRGPLGGHHGGGLIGSNTELAYIRVPVKIEGHFHQWQNGTG